MKNKSTIIILIISFLGTILACYIIWQDFVREIRYVKDQSAREVELKNEIEKNALERIKKLEDKRYLETNRGGKG